MTNSISTVESASAPVIVNALPGAVLISAAKARGTSAAIVPVAAFQVPQILAHLASRTGHAVGHAVGHADTARIIGAIIGHTLEGNGRITLTDSSLFLLCAYTGPRLPEGATTLPEGAEIAFAVVGIGSGRAKLAQECTNIGYGEEDEV